MPLDSYFSDKLQDMEYKSNIREIKAIQEGKNLFIEGYAAVFGNKDSYGDIIVPGAFAETISGANGKRIKLCYQHDFDDIIGKIIELREDEKGLFMKAKISNTTMGKDIAELIQDGAIDEFSIGYSAVSWEITEEARLLKEVKLYEISLVGRAANVEAVLTSTEVKKEKEIVELTDEEIMQKKAELEKEIERRIFNKFLKSI